VETLERIRLEPVLELEPGNYSSTERTHPQKSGEEVPDEWEKYWRTCLADSGLSGLVNLRPGSWQVPVRTLEGDVLDRILKAELADRDLSLDESPSLSGGFALLADQRPVIEAQCCGDLSIHGDWESAALYEEKLWHSFWIGHPHLPARRMDGWLELAAPTDELPSVPLWRVRPEALLKAVAEAREELQRFAPRLGAVLRCWPLKDPVEEVALCLAGLRSE
jgi:hypothetical protein